MKMNKSEFLRWFNRSFWKAFIRSIFPIDIPKAPVDVNRLPTLTRYRRPDWPSPNVISVCYEWQVGQLRRL